MEPVTTAALIGAAASAVGLGTNAVIQGKMNKRSERVAKEMYAMQRADALSDWHMLNAYNDPSAQMARLKAAGLNPNLVYGKGADATTSSPRGSTTHQPKFEAPRLDMGSIVGDALATQQAMVNIRRTQAETEAIEARTAGVNFQNALNELIGLDEMYHKYMIEKDKVEYATMREKFDYDAWAAANFQGKPSSDPSSPLAAAYKAKADLVLQELSNAKKLGDIRTFEATIKRFESDLAKNGIPPNSPWYYKLIGDLLMKVIPDFSPAMMFK